MLQLKTIEINFLHWLECTFSKIYFLKQFERIQTPDLVSDTNVSNALEISFHIVRCFHLHQIGPKKVGAVLYSIFTAIFFICRQIRRKL